GNTSEFSQDHAVNTPPTVSIVSPGAATEGTPVVLTSDVVDPDAGETFSYAWTVTTPSGSTLSSGSANTQPTFTLDPTQTGVYTVTLVVTDSQGGVGTGNLNLSVGAPQPTVVIQSNPTGPAPVSGVVDGTINLQGALAAPAGDSIASYAWSVAKDGAAYSPGTTVNAQSFSFTPSAPGNYVITLTAVDANGAAATAIDSILVTSSAPVAQISGAPATSPEGATLTLSNQITAASLTGTLGYLWSVTKDRQPYALPTGTVVTGPTFTFTPDDEGSYQVSLSVTGGGQTGIAPAVSIKVVEAPLTATIADAATNTAPQTSIEIGTPVSLTGSGGTPGTNDSSTTTLAWTVSDSAGEQVAGGSGASFNFTPHDVGLYVV
ncbi:MAG: PKD domain-containing protein, partial [Candidatus Saccharimonadales bacterium]